MELRWYGIWLHDDGEGALDEWYDQGYAIMETQMDGITGPGYRCSSTRMELPAVALGLTAPRWIHIRSESKAVANKTKLLINAAPKWNNCGSTKYWPKKGPYKKPWELHKDGDLEASLAGHLTERRPQHRHQLGQGICS